MDKERILQLLKEGTIDIHEAIGLLEELGDPSATAETESGDSSTRLAEIEDDLLPIQEQLRQLEVFAEIDELTPEMVAQREALLQEQQSLLQEQATLQSQAVTDEDLWSDLWQESKETMHDLGKKGRVWGKQLSDSVADFLDNFEMKDLNIDLSVPWLKASEETVTYEWPADELAVVHLNAMHGDVTVFTHDKSTIYLANQVKRYGSDVEDVRSAFEADNTVDYAGGVLTLDYGSPRYVVNTTLYVPTHRLKQIVCDLVQGDLDVRGVQADQLTIRHKNGALTLDQIESDQLKIQALNSDILINHSVIKASDIQNGHGDIRYQGAIGDVTIQAGKGNCYLTKMDTRASQLSVQVMVGTVKIAVPAALGLTADLYAGSGAVHSRLHGVTPVAADYTTVLERTGEAERVTLHGKLNYGDYYLKDTTEE